MIDWNRLLAYGEQVPDYEVRVVNEREARAAASILFVGAFLSLANGVMLGTTVFSKFFVTFFAIDFTIRVLQPRYAPSLLLARLFVRNQKPEYVGATQKRFAWTIGLFLAWPMFYLLVFYDHPTPVKVFGCIFCMVLLFFEGAFSICLGCKLYELIKRKDPKYCPGGVCELQVKDPVQKFTPAQAAIVLITLFLMAYGTYAYFQKLPDKTTFMQHMRAILMSDQERERLEEQELDKEFDEYLSK